MSDDVIIHLIEDGDINVSVQDSGVAQVLGQDADQGILLGVEDVDLTLIESTGAVSIIANARYVHTQGPSSSIWTVNHYLGMIPSAIAVVDTANSVVYGSIVHVSTDQLIISFSAPFSGTAYIST